jgi:hypothetical protein
VAARRDRARDRRAPLICQASKRVMQTMLSMVKTDVQASKKAHARR